MTSEIPKPAEIRRTKGYLLRRILSKWPFLVWVAMGILTYSLYERGVRFERMNGAVIAETEIISALEKGEILELAVTEKGDLVNADQLVVRLNHEIAQGELDAYTAMKKFENFDNRRKFGGLKTSLESDIADLKAKKAADETTLKLLQESIVGLREKRERKEIPQSDLDDALIKEATLAATVPITNELLKSRETQLGETVQLIDDLDAFNAEDDPNVRLYNRRIERMKLKSANGGKVSAIYFRAGSVVDAGVPIVEIINLKSRGARGFILEKDADKVSVGMPIFISPTDAEGEKYYNGKITYISPQITSVPDVGSGVSGRMIKGREITCSFDQPDIDLLPGRGVSIHLKKPGKFSLFSFGSK